MSTLKLKILLLALGISSSLFSTTTQDSFPWKARLTPLDTSIEKMWKNAKKAVEEHHNKSPSSAYAPLQEAVPSLKSLLEPLPQGSLNFFYEASEDTGLRESMEDVHFFKELEDGILLGLLDGHGGYAVANYAAEQFSLRFEKTLYDLNKNVHQTFEKLIDEVQQEIATKKEWSYIGATVVLCFIDKRTHQIYTATIGDSEANIYRKNNEGTFQSIPLSCVRDWSSTKDALRASIALDKPHIAWVWPNVEESKRLRYPSPFFGVNVSRSIGDTYFSQAVTHKPKITINQIQEGDILIIGCDGLRDFVSEGEITQLLQSDNLAKKLVDYSINVKNSQDNVTVIAVHIR